MMTPTPRTEYKHEKATKYNNNNNNNNNNNKKYV